MAAVYFYGNIHISLAALFFTIETYVLLGLQIDLNYLGFVFGSTLAMYNLHRLIGLKKITKHIGENRFSVISQEKSTIIILGICGALISCYGLIQMNSKYWPYLVCPILFSMLYVIPLFPNSKRLRDYNLIKIFLISIIWAWISVIVPQYEQIWKFETIFFFIEHLFFILAITIPFDIRDQSIDQKSGVKTLVTSLGAKSALRLSYFLMLLAFCCALTMIFNGTLPVSVGIILFICYTITSLSISRSEDKRTELFYTAWLDGLILIRSAIIFVFLFYY